VTSTSANVNARGLHTIGSMETSRPVRRRAVRHVVASRSARSTVPHPPPRPDEQRKAWATDRLRYLAAATIAGTRRQSSATVP
jgi:hypothetical protein